MDEERRRSTRRHSLDALLREALALRRTGELAQAREHLRALLELAPDHELARALLVVTDAQLGNPTHGSFGEARLRSIDLVRVLDPAGMAVVARAALAGVPDAEAVGALLDGGKPGVLAVLGALAEVDVSELHARLRIVVGLRARDLARLGIDPEEVPPALLRSAVRGIERGDPDCALLAGALRVREARRLIERLLAREEQHLRNAGAFALELLADPASRPALEEALARAQRRGERVLVERALAALGKG